MTNEYNYGLRGHFLSGIGMFAAWVFVYSFLLKRLLLNSDLNLILLDFIFHMI